MNNSSRDRERLERRSFLLLLLLVTLLFLWLLKPFFSAVFWACIVALLFHPLHFRLRRRWNHPNLVVLATLAVCILVGVVPFMFVFASFLREGADLYGRLQRSEIDFGAFVDQIRQGFPLVQDVLERFHLDLDVLTVQLSGAAVTVSRYLAQKSVQLGQGTLQFFVNLGLMLYLAFFMLRDGSRLVDLVVRALPLGDERERLLLGKFAEVSRATVKGSLMVAAVQGMLGGIIFRILGIPGPVLWGVVMILLSLIPMVGSGLIWGPVALYLLATGSWVRGLVLAAFGLGVVGLVDNVLRPVLVGRDTKLPDYLVLLSTLGGFILFGMNGFVIGPLVAALFIAFWEIFIREFNL
ncbi:MAG: AI-2E family transporter [Deltaproteobacteria bacterium]|nr:AI-2E family transporter [Candidatus Anaeroferrophillacea bacterium]